jgi:hypothetical protein
MTRSARHTLFTVTFSRGLTEFAVQDTRVHIVGRAGRVRLAYRPAAAMRSSTSPRRLISSP